VPNFTHHVGRQTGLLAMAHINERLQECDAPPQLSDLALEIGKLVSIGRLGHHRLPQRNLLTAKTATGISIPKNKISPEDMLNSPTAA
jgi:hypothetical protein